MFQTVQVSNQTILFFPFVVLDCMVAAPKS
jgi:hypothetical protein